MSSAHDKIARRSSVLGILLCWSIGAPAITHAVHSNSHIKLEPAAHHGSSQTNQSEKASKINLGRWKHAKELLGKRFQKSIVKAVYKSFIRSKEKIGTLDSILNRWTHQALKGRWKKRSSEITKVIIRESNKYGLDPTFLMAIIQSESNFNPLAVGSAGEIGLMQITPQTGRWIASKFQLPWKGAKSLKDPITNIQFGAAYIAYLREKFEFKSQFYIAAYNMGSRKLQKAIAKQGRPKEYHTRVMANYVHLYSVLNSEFQSKLS